MTALFDPIRLGGPTLKNRAALARIGEAMEGMALAPGGTPSSLSGSGVITPLGLPVVPEE